ncbi:predicted protein [Sclerotinia sclerotiorum 1980 UF-70]|uniref:Uncharacterized protein n=1 Tax=Sclerotinia sclerotiorum (strain ATCC 18683 / 1980 / Ss-1) TaxID=665079 RepID=A7EEQ1_SCLS1|nr:predicted protein [Sclerotinia sclerotiorum 1980 UF-70]EDO01317.1 predicted protein [Sclerotinia sclerotiorum 1980 UF-70]
MPHLIPSLSRIGVRSRELFNKCMKKGKSYKIRQDKTRQYKAKEDDTGQDKANIFFEKAD